MTNETSAPLPNNPLILKFAERMHSASPPLPTEIADNTGQRIRQLRNKHTTGARTGETRITEIKRETTDDE